MSKIWIGNYNGPKGDAGPQGEQDPAGPTLITYLDTNMPFNTEYALSVARNNPDLRNSLANIVRNIDSEVVMQCDVKYHEVGNFEGLESDGPRKIWIDPRCQVKDSKLY